MATTDVESRDVVCYCGKRLVLTEDERSWTHPDGVAQCYPGSPLDKDLLALPAPPWEYYD